MPYNSTGRVVHDADAHIMETPGWLVEHADPAIRERVRPLEYAGGNELRQTGDPEEQLRDLEAAFARLAERHRSEDYTSVEAAEIMNRKNFAATGSFLAEDRGRAIDLLGFSSQLVFNTFHNRRLRDWEHSTSTLRSVPHARTTEGWSSSARATLVCFPPVTCRSARSTTPK